MADVTGTFYAAEDAIDSFGGQLEVGDAGSPEGFEAIAGIKSVKPGEVTTKDKDRTHLRSPDNHMEHAPGLRDSAPIEFEGIYLKDAQSLTTAGGGTGAFQTGGLPAMHADRRIVNFRLLASDGTFVIIRGYVSKFSLGELTPDTDWTYTGALQPTQAYDHP